MQRKILLLLVGLLAAAAATFAGAASAGHASPGVVFTLSNQAAGNAVLVYDRSATGTLTPAGSYPTGGLGSGGGLGSQGSLILSAHGHRLFAVNAASNSVTEFKVTKDRLKWVTTVPSGGSTPISLTYRKHVLYVLNGGGAGNIAGFKVHGESLTPLAGSTLPLGAGSSGPAQVAFTPDGKALVVTEKSSNTIDVYPVRHDVAGAPTVSASAGGTPFGFDFGGGHLLVSEAAGSASSYDVGPAGVSVISGAVTTHQAAPCWLIATVDGKYAYTANAGSGTLSAFSVSLSGALTLLDASGVTASLGAGSHPLDETVSSNGEFLYNLTDGLHRITGFRLNADGRLTHVDQITGLPAGAAGIAAS
ncbi:MAG TPA: beta-propeller fold lactonase family protein [Gaiellaceae bacterium]|nr:beta-propeller fold lactonase family protein [Gaiellaceae bacterium]